jgi:hypothetical protein
MSNIETKTRISPMPYMSRPRVINSLIDSYMTPSKEEIKKQFKKVLRERVNLIPCIMCGEHANNAYWHGASEGVFCVHCQLFIII